MSNSVRFFVPAPQSCVRVLAFLCILVASAWSRGPENERAGGAPGGVLAFNVALVRRDATLARRGRPAQNRDPASRRSTVALSAQEPFRTRHCLRIRPEGCPRPAIDHGGLRPRAFRSRLYRPLSTPLPAPPAGSSPETPLTSEDGNSIYHLQYVVNRKIQKVVVPKRIFPAALRLVPITVFSLAPRDQGRHPSMRLNQAQGKLTRPVGAFASERYASARRSPQITPRVAPRRESPAAAA
jgi:hypothetical protein